jgi:endonuclease/exonuclease/phosphatase family metal-dependent hydrolase
MSSGSRSETSLTATTTLTVASMNLHCGLGWRGEPYDVAAAISRLDAEVICLQEAWLPEPAAAVVAAGDSEPHADAVAAAASQLGAALHRVPQRSGIRLADIGLHSAGPAGRASGDFCLAVLTTLPVISYQVHSLGRAPLDRLPRLAQVICLRLATGADIRIVNTHLTHRLTSPVQLGALWRYLRRQPGPTIIAGDLNMPRLIAGRLAGFEPAVSGSTWPAWQPWIQLDHLLASREIATIVGSVLPPAGSDHFPVRATIAISPDSRPDIGRAKPQPGRRVRET